VDVVDLGIVVDVVDLGIVVDVVGATPEGVVGFGWP